MTTLKKHWLAIVLAIIAGLLLFGFFHQCSHGGKAVPASSLPSIASSADATTPTGISAWFTSLDWTAVGYAVGALLTGMGAFYQLYLKWKAGAVSVEALVSEGKGLFTDVKAVEDALKRPVVSVPPSAAATSVPPAATPAVEASPKS